MTAQEIVDTITAENKSAIPEGDVFTREQVIELMLGAGMHGFGLGSNVAISMIHGALLVQLSRVTSHG